jgi:hypothetical protein
MRVVLALILAASATAFAPAAQTSKTAALNAIPIEKEVGAQAPVGFFEYVSSLSLVRRACTPVFHMH